jgi:hypothetical protein
LSPSDSPRELKEVGPLPELNVPARLEGRNSRALKNLMQAKTMKQVMGTGPQSVKEA